MGVLNRAIANLEEEQNVPACTGPQRINNRQRTMNRTMYSMIKNTTGKPVSADALTHTHTHTDNAMEVYRKHTGFPRSRCRLSSLRRNKEIEEKGSVRNLTTLRSWLNTIPIPSPFLSFYSPRKGRRYSPSHPHYYL